MGLHRFRGWLAIEPDLDELSVDLRIDGRTLELQTALQSLGVWAVTDVMATRRDDGRFLLRLAREEAIFRAEDPLSFTAEVSSTLQAKKKTLRALFNNRSAPIETETRRHLRESNVKAADTPSPQVPVAGRHLKAAEILTGH